MRVVAVSFRELTAPVPEPNPHRKLYHFQWHLEVEPQLGDRVIVEGQDSEQPAVVMRVDSVSPFPVEGLRRVIRIATSADYDRGPMLWQQNPR